MADEIDMTQDRIESEQALLIADIQHKAADIPEGEPGECFYCGEWLSRVVWIAAIDEFCCGRCRDRRGLE